MDFLWLLQLIPFCRRKKDRKPFSIKNNSTRFGVYLEIFDYFSKGKKSFGVKELGEAMQSYGIKTSELELQVK